MLRRPLYKDWIFWLWAVMCFAGIRSSLDYYPDGIRTDFERLAFTFDVALVLGINSVLFLVIPAAIRGAIRRSKSRRATARS